MPLLELLNNKPDFFYYYGGPGNFTQKKLQYDKDRPGAGSSGLPYIKFGIDPENASSEFKRYYEANRSGLDFPIRGGAVDFEAQSQTTTPSNSIDKKRIEAFMKDKPRGDVFLLKQVGLQLSNPKIPTGTELFSINKNQVLPILENTRVYNGGKNTLAQIGVQGTGAHITRNGIVPFNPIANYYENVLSKEKLMSIDEVNINNRLLILNNLKMTQEDSRESSRVSFGNSAKQISQLGIAYNRNILFEYLGGPGSVYGVGRTTIRRSKTSDTTKAIEYPPMPMTTLAMTYEKIRNQQTARPVGKNRIKNYNDFRSNIDDYSGDRLPKSFWQGTKGAPINPPNESLALTNPQEYAIQYAAYQALNNQNNKKIDIRFFDGSGKIDKLNKLRPFTPQNNNYTGWQVAGDDADDIIKFGFECISNDNRTRSTFLIFRAFLSTITDNNQATLNGFKYMGRAESFYTYGGFERSISFGFKLVAMSKQELLPMYEKLNYLVSQTYPDYHPVTGIMRAPLIKLTIGDYVSSLPGFLESVNFTMDQNSPWDIDEGTQLAQYIDVTVSFKPIFKDLPQRSTNGNNYTSIISAVPVVKNQMKLSISPQQQAQQDNQQQVEEQVDIPESIAQLVNPNRPI